MNIEALAKEKASSHYPREDGKFYAYKKGFIEGAKQYESKALDDLPPLAKQIFTEAIDLLRFYSKGGNSNQDIWKHDELGYFTGKRAREFLKKHGLEKV